MKKFLIKFFSLIVVFILVYIFSLLFYNSVAPPQLKKNLLYNRHGGGYLYTRLKEADTTKNIDILVVGSSHAYRGFDPRIIGQGNGKVFILGSSAQSPIQTEYLIDKYIDILKPKMVLYEVYYVTMELDGAESAIDVFSNVSKLDYNLLKMAFKINSVKAYNTLIYCFLREQFGIKDITDLQKNGLDQYVKGGYIERKMIKNEYKGKEEHKRHAIQINQEQLEAFKSICNKLRQKKIKTILVQSPIPVAHYRSIANRKFLDSVFYSVKSAEYYNYNELDTFRNEHFFDYSHLNQTGVEKFNRTLSKTIRINKGITN